MLILLMFFTIFLILCILVGKSTDTIKKYEQEAVVEKKRTYKKRAPRKAKVVTKKRGRGRPRKEIKKRSLK